MSRYQGQHCHARDERRRPAAHAPGRHLGGALRRAAGPTLLAASGALGAAAIAAIVLSGDASSTGPAGGPAGGSPGATPLIPPADWRTPAGTTESAAFWSRMHDIPGDDRAAPRAASEGNPVTGPVGAAGRPAGGAEVRPTAVAGPPRPQSGVDATGAGDTKGAPMGGSGSSGPTGVDGDRREEPVQATPEATPPATQPLPDPVRPSPERTHRRPEPVQRPAPPSRTATEEVPRAGEARRTPPLPAPAREGQDRAGSVPGERGRGSQADPRRNG